MKKYLLKKYKLKTTIALTLVIALLTTSCGAEQKIVSGGGGTKFLETEEPETVELEDIQAYIYKGANDAMQCLSFLKVGGSYWEEVLYYNGSTIITNRFNEPMTVAELIPGDVYEISCKGDLLTEVKQSEAVWTFQDVVNYDLELERDMLTVGSDKYQLEEGVPVFDGFAQFTREQINQQDILTLTGYKNTLLSVRITTGHGRLKFQNAEMLENGYFVLGNVAAGKIIKGQKASVRAGEFLLRVAGSGYGGSVQVTILPGETTVVDLKKVVEATVKRCEVTFELLQEGTHLSINGQEIDPKKPVYLEYGIHRIKARKNGYETWSKLLFVNSKTAKVTIELEEESTKKNNSNSSSSTNSNNSNNNNHSNNSSSQNDDDDDGSLIDNETYTLVNEVLDILTGN